MRRAGRTGDEDARQGCKTDANGCCSEYDDQGGHEESPDTSACSDLSRAIKIAEIRTQRYR